MEKKDFLLFVKRLFIFAILVIMVDRFAGACLKKLYFSQKKGQFSQITYSLDSTRQDVLVFGSSRAIRHYDSDILAEKLNKTVYNVGMDGQMIPYYRALQEVIFKRYTPQVIILDINPWELNKGEGKYHKLSALLPYVEQHQELLPYINYANELEYLKLNSKVYPFNSSLFIGIYNVILKNKLPDYANGYLPLDRTMKEKEYKYSKEKSAFSAQQEEKQKDIYDDKSIELLHQFLKDTKEKNVKTLVVISPTIFSNSFNSTKLQKIKEIVSAYPHVEFYDYSQDDTFIDNYKLFADIYHLNKEGAELFTAKLANSIIQ